MISFMIASVFLTNFLKDSLKNTRTAWVRELNINRHFEQLDFIKELKKFSQVYFYNFLKQLSDDCHTRKFLPFKLKFTNADIKSYTDDLEPLFLDMDSRSIFELVNERQANLNDKFIKKDKIIFDDVITLKTESVLVDNKSKLEKRFIDLLYEASVEIYNTRFKSK